MKNESTKTQARKDLARLVMESLASYDPFMFGSDDYIIALHDTEKDLASLAGCYAIIAELSDIIRNA